MSWYERHLGLVMVVVALWWPPLLWFLLVVAKPALRAWFGVSGADGLTP